MGRGVRLRPPTNCLVSLEERPGAGGEPSPEPVSASDTLRADSLAGVGAAGRGEVRLALASSVFPFPLEWM